MFDALSDKLQKTFRNLRGLGKISETNVPEALRERSEERRVGKECGSRWAP